MCRFEDVQMCGWYRIQGCVNEPDITRVNCAPKVDF